MSRNILADAGALRAELDRLRGKGLPALGYGDAELERMAGLTLRINALKRTLRAVIPAHVYQRPEVLLGVADFTGDSYRLSKLCADVEAEVIVFCGVRFMAETAKILNPSKEVLLPAAEAGCSLADSVTAKDVRALKARHPGLPVVTYINTTADVKAESDVIVTSANAAKILRWMYERHPRLIFLPDAWMARNLARELGKKIGSEMVVWDGRCVVHESFDASCVEHYRKVYPGVRILAHAECDPKLVALVDFVGGTGDMMRYVRETPAPCYMLVTECGLGDLARTELPGKRFVPMCRLCPDMKAVDLGRVLEVLEHPKPLNRVVVDPETARKAKVAIDKMFEIAQS